MIEQLFMWKLYFSNLIHNPVSLYTLIISVAASALFYFLFRRAENIRLKINFLAGHVIFLIFPFVFSAFSWRCLMPVMSCSPMAFMLLTPISVIAVVILSLIAIPFLYNWSNKSKAVRSGFIKKFVESKSRELGIKEPKVYALNDATPMAYSITNLQPAIFISAGLAEALSKRELEAVLLHELHHHRSKAYFWKFSLNMLRIFTPVAMFIDRFGPMEGEENSADCYAASEQKTYRYLKSAKRKVGEYGNSKY